MARKMEFTDEVNEVASLIAKMKTPEELNAVSRAVKDRWGQMKSAAVAEMQVGDRVWFKSRRGHRIEGTVTKVNQKTCGVETDSGERWKVGGTILNRIED